MSKSDAYIVAAVRTPVGKAPRGGFRSTRPDDMLAHVIRGALERCPGLKPDRIDDVIVGCAQPEAEQGMNVARIGLLLAGLPNSVPGVTINRFCASGLNAVAMAADRIRLGEAEVMIAAGTESMSLVPMMGNKIAMNPAIFNDEHIAIAYGMGITAEKVAQRWQVSRESQDSFASASHDKALSAIAAKAFVDEILPYTVASHSPGQEGKVQIREQRIDTDEGPRPGTNPDTLAKLRSVFAAKGTVTAGNSSQMSDGAAAVVLMSESMIKALELQPLARFVGFAVAGVAPGDHGHRPQRGYPQSTESSGLATTPTGLDRVERSLRRASLGGNSGSGSKPGRSQPAGRGHCLRPSSRGYRRDSHRYLGTWLTATSATLWHGDHVYRHRHGSSRRVRGAISF